MRNEEKLERDYQELEKLGQELGVPIFVYFVDLVVKDKDGNVLREHRQRSHSWNRNAYNALFTFMSAYHSYGATFEAGALTAKDYTGAIHSNTSQKCGIINRSCMDIPGGYRGNAANADTGIVIGMSDTAESFEHYTLASKITHGTGLNQMSYVQSEPVVMSYVGTTLKCVHARYFNNNSAATITVKEVGLFDYDSLWADTYFLMSRDVLSAPISIPVSGQLKVTYEISLVYPA